jgi:hypothetical protein
MDLITAAKGKKQLLITNGKTVDIQKVVLSVSKDGIHTDTKEFSKDFKPTYNSLWGLWRWVKTNIEYIEDPDGVQWIKDPARLYADRAGDCKSFTLFIVSVLQNLQIPYTIRFTSYIKGSKRVTHVYPVAHLNGKDIILDAVWYAFDSEKKYTYKQDFKENKDMIGTAIYRLSGTQNARIIRTDNVLVTSKEFEQAAANIPDSYLNNDITEMTQAQFAAFMGFSVKNSLMNTGGQMAFQMPVLANTGAAVNSILSKIGDAIKNAWKKVVNWVFKTGLKLCAPYFLYTFIKKKVGKKTDAKKAKQDSVLAWMASVTGTPISNFLMSISAGIKDKTGKTPEQILKELSGNKIGDPISAAMLLLPLFKDKKVMDAIKTIISKIVSIFKKQAPAIDADGASSPEELATEASLMDTGEITQPDNNNPANNTPPVLLPNPEQIPDIPTGTTVTDTQPKPDSAGSGFIVPLALAAALVLSQK